jgi:hypothetical protein
MKFYLKIIFLFLISFETFFAQDSKDTSKIVKEIRIPDSLLSVPLKTHGKLFQGDYLPFRKINKWDIQLLNNIGMSDIIAANTPFYNMNLGAYSTYNSFSAFGSSSKSISFGYNGRNISDMDIGSLNPEQFSSEFFENIEIFVGSDAVIFGDNAASVFINFQEIRYNTEKPFTRLWFGNAGYSYLGADGIYSQNISPNVNFTFGFRSYNSLGGFENSWGNNWNGRIILRWNPDNQSSISFTENFSDIGSGTNGGIDTQNSENIFDRLSAVPKFPGLNERTFRHDLTLSATRKFDTSGQNSIALNLYMSNVVWDRSSGDSISFELLDTNYSVYNYKYSYFGADGRYEFSPVDAFSLKIGGVAELDFLDKSFYSSDFNGLSSAVYGQTIVKLSDILKISGGARIFSKFGNYGLAYGVKQISYFTDRLNLMLDLSYSDRLPYPVEGLNLNGEQHLALLGELRYDFKDSTRLIIGGYIRSIFSPILGRVVENYTNGNYLNYYNGEGIYRAGAYIEYSKRFLNDFTVIAKGLFQIGLDESGSAKNDFPLFNANFRVFYTYNVGRSNLRLGLESGFLTDFKGDNFYPVHRTFYQGNYNSDFMITGINGFAEIKLGNSFVKISYQNLLNSNYYYVAVNPMFNRNFRLTANWAFAE